MRVVAGVVLVAAALGGCSSIADGGLQDALDSGDVTRIANGIRELNTSGAGDSEVKRRAVDVLSVRYMRKFADSPDQTLVNLENFDANCVRLISQKCSDSAREEISRLEAARHKRAAELRSEIAKQAEAARQEMIAEFRSGERKVTSLNEALIAYEPAPGDGLAIRPPISGGDGKYYVLQAYITAKQGSSYIFWWADSPLVSRGTYGMPAMGAIFENPAYVDSGVGFNQHVKVVGRYVGNQTIGLADGSGAIVPVFEDAYIFPWSRQ